MDVGRPEVLPSNYYQVNFHALASFVSDIYHDLLTEGERNWYSHIVSSSESAQRLYIRLLSRKPSVFRISRLRYPEIEQLADASKILAEFELADVKPPASLATLLSAFTKPELLTLLNLPSSNKLPRVELVEAILCASDPQKADYQKKLQQADEWVTLLGHEHWTVYRVCFFGNLHQDSSDFVLSDMGTVVYESYKLDTQSRYFSTRSQLDAHLRYFECSALYDTVDVRNAEQLLWLMEHLPAPVEGDRHLRRRIDRFRNRIARHFERLGHIEQALQLYRKSIHPPARERQVRLLLSRENMTDANTIVDAMLDQPFNDSEAQLALRLERLVAKARGMQIPKLPTFQPDTTELTLLPSSERVECIAQAYYSQCGHCFYTENSLVSGVLGLFIWDIVFHPVAGVFFNPFQTAPVDFYEPAFCEQRSELLALRFTELSDSHRFSVRVMDGFSKHNGKSNPLVRWKWLSQEAVTMALERVPMNHWRLMFERILSDLREYSSGFPDLILFGFETGYEFIEIKGPGDTLQNNQRRWMRYFSEHRIPCRVVNVSWATEIREKPSGG